MDGPVIQVQNLRKDFGDFVAVEDLSFTLWRGEIVGLLGPNGAGKTTTIHMILGLTTPTKGKIRIFEMDLSRHRTEILQRCNFASAYVALPWNLPVRHNLRIFAELYCVKGAQKKIDFLMELLEIRHLADEITGQLSSGEQTRVNLCKALLNDPELLLLDEPTASLDPDMAQKVRSLLKDLCRDRGITMLYTSHNMREVEQLCTRVLFLHKGRLLADGTPKQIVEQFKRQNLEEVFITVARGSMDHES